MKLKVDGKWYDTETFEVQRYVYTTTGMENESVQLPENAFFEALLVAAREEGQKEIINVLKRTLRIT